VVDGEGKPLVVYHGTDEPNIRAFRDDEQFFSSSARAASGYARGAGAYSFPNVMPTYLSLKNPLVVDAKGKKYNRILFDEGNYWTVDALAAEARKRGNDGLIVKNVIDEHDGAIDKEAADVYVAFSPTQIKSIHNSGAWGVDDARILYSYAPTQEFLASRDTIAERIYEAVKKINPAVKVKVVDELLGKGARLLSSGATTTEEMPVAGSYSAAKSLITVALSRGNPETTAYHEAWHSIESLLTEPEQKTLRDAFPGTKSLSHDEQTAYAFQEWATRKKQDQLPAIKRVFAKIREMLSAIGNALRGNGFNTVESIFKKAKGGEIGQRNFLDDAIRYGYEPSPERKALDALDDEKYSIDPENLKKDNKEAFDIIHRIIKGRDLPKGALESMKSLPQRARDVIDSVRGSNALAIKVATVDQFAALEAREADVFGKVRDAAVSAYKMARMMKGNPKLLQLTMGIKDKSGGWIGGQIRWNAEKGMTEIIPGTKPFMAIFEELGAHGQGMVRLWEAWAVANRSQRLIKEGRENLLTQDEIDALLELEEKYPFFRRIMDDWTEFNKNYLDMAEQAGLINAEKRKLWESNDYVPFYRVLSEDADKVKAPRGKSGLQGQRSGIKALKGGDEQLGGIIENMIMNVSHLMDASLKNIAMQRIDDLYEGYHGWEPAKMDFERAFVSADEAAKKLRGIGLDIEHLSPDEKKEWVGMFSMTQPKGNDVISFMRDGKVHYRTVGDPLLLTAVTNLGHDKLLDIVKTLRLDWFKRALTTGVTSTPTFMARNTFRDALNTMIITDVQHDHFGKAAKGFKQSLMNDPLKIKLMASGAGFYGYYQAAPEKFAKQIDHMGKGRTLLDTPRDLWNAWQEIGEASEQMNRIALYEHLLEQGVSEAEAAYQARDLLDFQLQGANSIIKFMIQTVPFMNPRLQGLYKLHRAYKDSPEKERAILAGKLMKTMTLRGGLLMAASIALWAMNMDDERYKDLEEWDKDMNYHLFVAGEHFTLPRAFEISAIFSTIPERMMNLMFGEDDGSTFANAIGRMFVDTFSFDPTPQALAPIMEQMANKNFFTGYDIVPMGMENALPETQYNYRTSPTAIALAQAMPDFLPGAMRSPMRIEAFLRGYFGQLPDAVFAGSDVITRGALGLPAPAEQRVDSWPVVRAFYRSDPVRTTKWVSEFYDMRAEINATYASIKDYQEMGRMDSAKSLLEGNRELMAAKKTMDGMYKNISDINKALNQTRNSTVLSPAEKRTREDALTTRRNAIAKQTQKVMERMDDYAERIKEKPPVSAAPKPMPIQDMRQLYPDAPAFYNLMQKVAPAKGKALDSYQAVGQ
jgi:hypothetical protein